MGKIKKLDNNVIAKIAAGEVIERPAYIVKELIENSIDAGAKDIEIELVNYGRDRIRITDDGIGMGKDDLEQSVLHHTTSKIGNIYDLVRLETHGFRGEALSSIAAISTLTITSRKKGSAEGNKIVVEDGKIREQDVLGMPQGTTVIVEHIFEKVPARKKFLKTSRTEYRLIMEVVGNYILKYTDISFRLINDDRTVVSFGNRENLVSRIKGLNGDFVVSNIVPIRSNESSIIVEGFISRPEVSYTGQNKLFLFVNNRRVYDPIIASAIKDAYQNLLDTYSYPFAVLFISIPGNYIDINIHPRKEQIRFLDQQNIYDTIYKATVETLNKNNLTFSNISKPDNATANYLGRFLKSAIKGSTSLKKELPIVQIHSMYIVTQSEKGVLFIDQHAAHEAIIYRKLLDIYENEKEKKQRRVLEVPILVQLSIGDDELFFDNASFFESLGFSFEEFGDRVVRINSIPSLLADQNIQDLIFDILEELKTNLVRKRIENYAKKIIAYIACKKAIKAGMSMTLNEMKDLIGQLRRDDFLYTCPHGRPVKIEVLLKDMHKGFMRTK